MKILDVDQKKAYLEEGKVRLPWWAREVDSMDIVDKFIIYYHYSLEMLVNKHDFHIEDNFGDNWKSNGRLDRIYSKRTPFRIVYYGEVVPIMTFDQFISFERIHIYDHGENWNDPHKYAQRYSLNADGIYHWWSAFRKELKSKVSFVDQENAK